MPLENIDASLAILKHACNFQTFQHKIVEKLQNLPHASLQELKFISEFIGDLDSKEEIQNYIIDHIQLENKLAFVLCDIQRTLTLESAQT